jgi:predicted nucleic acid-binding protein
VIYLDSSALVKLALAEPETAALARWLAERADQPLISSALYRAEVPRAIWRAEPGALPRGYRMLKRIARVALTPDVLDNSATLPPRDLSAAQAIHLASALAVKRDLTAFVAYDERLLAAAKDAGLPVAAPGSPRLSRPGTARTRMRAGPGRGRAGDGGGPAPRRDGGRGHAAGPFRKKRTFCATDGRAASSLKSARQQAVLRAAAARTPRGRARVRP